MKNRDVSILLQNENGPCPLLAASNCLLLRGAVSLAAATTNIGMATLDDIANMLANHAMTLAATKQRQNSNTMTNDDDAKHPQKSNPRTNEFVDDDVHGQFCLNELMQYIPKFQYGMVSRR